MDVAGVLRDMALVHSSPHARVAYKRAAQAVLALDDSLEVAARRQPLQDLRNIGPASERLIRECLDFGHSPTVERAIEGSGRRDEVESVHRWRGHFLSRAGARQILSVALAGVVSRDDYRGDLQMHTEWSDGAESVEEMVAAAQGRGYRYIAVSDHSYGLRIAGGMSMDAARAQHREIDRLNRLRNAGVHVIKAIEANIPTTGGLDMTPEELNEFELVLAAPHSKLRRPEDQTERMVAAVRSPWVHVLAHPRGRMYSRQGVLACWDEVFAAASRNGVAIELDGDPYRQDLDYALARRALEAGCLFALDSDAHSGAELWYSEIAIAHARLAGIPPERVINTWPAERLLAWAARKRPTLSSRPPSAPAPE